MEKLLSFSFIFYSLATFSQIQFNGDASQEMDSCYTITNDQQTQIGSLWSLNKLNLTEPFDIRFTMYFGDKDGGADGFAFALQSQGPDAIGLPGEGLGYKGISPSLGVEFDTYQNSSPNSDPASDHMAIQKNGNTNHSSIDNLAGPIDISPSAADVENNQFYWVRFTWNPFEELFQVYHDCNPRLTYQGDIINEIFNGNPEVYWGVTGSTGFFHNKQQVCLIDLTTEQKKLENQDLCLNDSIKIPYKINSEFTSNWTPNLNILSKNDTVYFFPEETTEYRITIKDECDIETKDTFEIFVPSEYDTIPDSTICDDGSITISLPKSSETQIYYWVDNSDSTIEISDSGIFQMGITQNSCESIDSIRIKLENCFIPPIPNIFTPNGDSYNEFFDLSRITNFETDWNLAVFNRWGKKVYEQLAYDNTWNGGDLSDGMYFYQIQKYGQEPLKGWVQIAR